jgi:hypothetical protein
MNLSEDAVARQINAAPWEPLPGMRKLRCTTCSYWFAAPADDVEMCPDCEIRLRKRTCAATAIK